MNRITEYTIQSCDDISTLRGIKMMPDSEPKGIFIISHGMAEHKKRYVPFMDHLCDNGYISVCHDHIGHGDSVTDIKDLGHIPLEAGADALVGDILYDAERIKAEHEGLPLVIFGNSSGSLIARMAISRAKKGLFDAALICGSGTPRTSARFALALAETLAQSNGRRSYSKFCEKLIFDSYNSRCERGRPFAWLTRDKNKADEYISDSKCGFRLTVSSLAALLSLQLRANSNETYEKTDKGLPILLLSGEDDPVGMYGEDVRKIGAAYKSFGISDIEANIYPEARHDLLSEINREQIYDDIISWTNEKLSRTK